MSLVREYTFAAVDLGVCSAKRHDLASSPDIFLLSSPLSVMRQALY